MSANPVTSANPVRGRPIASHHEGPRAARVAAPVEPLLEGYPRDATVPELFAAWAAATPDAPALESDCATYTYRQLDEATNRLARRFVRSGAGPGTVIAFLTNRSTETVVGWLAALKCGAAFMPLDPAYPRELLEYMVADAEPSLVLAQTGPCAAYPDLCGRPCLSLEAELAASATEDASRLSVERTATDLAYVMYTSGSTGKPKGVRVHHRGIVRLVRGQDMLPIAPGDCFLLSSALTFDVCTHDIWGPLLNGGRLAVVRSTNLTLDQIADAIARFRVTTLNLTSAIFHLFVDHRLGSLKPLATLIVAGDVMSPVHARRALEALPGTRIINAYGPTENTTFTTWYDLTNEGWGGGPVPIGRALAHTTTYVLDENNRPVAEGETGFLWTGGDGVALGYLNRPELNAERFLADPFASEAGALMYGTGDLARVLPGGDIEFLGRKDRQVKIAGKRIELDEIEMVLREDDEVADAMVLVETLGGDDKRIVAFAKPAPGATAEGYRDRLVGRLRHSLPEHMIPNDLRIVDAFPMTANGKVDRKALLTGPGNAVARRTRHITAPANTHEVQLAEVWKWALGLDEVGRDENFFDLGGKSLHLMRIHAEIKSRLGLRVDIVELFRRPTIAELAAFLHSDDTPVAAAGAAARQRALRQQDAMARNRAARSRSV